MTEEQRSAREKAPDSDEVDVLAWLGLLWRRRWLVLLVVFCCVVLAGVYGMLRAPKYVATAQLMAAAAPPGYTPRAPEEALSVVGGIWGGARARSNMTHALALQSPGVFRQALSRLPPQYRECFCRHERDLAGLPVAANAHVNTDIIVLRVTSESREAALALAGAIADVYVEQTRDTGIGLVSEARASLQPEAEKAIVNLATAEQMLIERRATSGVYNPKAALEAASERIADLRAQISDTRVQLAATTAELEASQRLRDSLPSTILASEIRARGALLEELEKEAAKLQMQRAIASTVFREDSPRTKVLSEQMSEAEARVAAAPDSVVSEQQQDANPTWLVVDEQLATLTGLRASLEEQLHVLEAELAGEGEWMREVSREEAEQDRLERGVQEQRDNYASIIRQLSLLGAGALARLPTVARLGEATAPQVASRGLRFLLPTGFLVGLILAIGVVFALEATGSRREDIGPPSPASGSAR